MKNLLLILFSFISYGAFSQVEQKVVSDSLIEFMENDSSMVLSNVNVFKDPRLEVLSERASLIAKSDYIEKKKNELGLNGVKNYDPIKRGTKTVTGSIVNRKGFRVVIYSGADRNAALNAKRIFMRQYTSTRSYMSYNAPNFKIRVGDFATKDEANKFMKQILKSFPSSFIVPDIVTIKNIHVN